VAEIVEVESLVRMSLCPPWIVGLCTYHREVVPVVSLTVDCGSPDLVVSPRFANGKPRRDAVLIMGTSQGVWGIAVDRDGTVITADRPERHEPRRIGGGIVTVGVIHQEAIAHTLIDAEATWHGLREAMVGWYYRVNERAAARRFGGSGSGSRLLDAVLEERA
jgi:chemotaxis signal transduction protein